MGTNLHGRHWVPEEVATLRQMWIAHKSDKEIGAVLERTPSAVQCRRAQMGLIRAKPKRPKMSDEAKRRKWRMYAKRSYRKTGGKRRSVSFDAAVQARLMAYAEAHDIAAGHLVAHLITVHLDLLGAPDDVPIRKTKRRAEDEAASGVFTF